MTKMAEQLARLVKEGKLTPTPTTPEFQELPRESTGIPAGEIFIIAAGEGSGKTTINQQQQTQVDSLRGSGEI